MDAVVQHPFARVPIPAPKGHQTFRKPTREEAEAAVRTLIAWAGDNPNREGLMDTPKRVVKAYSELFGGYAQDAAKDLERVFEDVQGYDDMVVLRDIPYFSHCEHHMVPFFGVAHIGYIPGETGHVTGLSKLARLVDVYARRLQVQERLTTQIAEAMVDVLEPQGVIVVIEAEHLCMTMRGVAKAGARTITSAVRGQLLNPATRAEAMQLISK